MPIDNYSNTIYNNKNDDDIKLNIIYFMHKINF